MGSDIINLIPFLLVGMTILIVAIITYSAHTAHKKREETRKALADAIGFSFRDFTPELPEKFPGLMIFNEGVHRKAKFTLEGKKEDAEIIITDYEYKAGTKEKRTYKEQTICIVTSENLDLPPFFLRKKYKFFDWLAKLFSLLETIKFDQDKTFSDNFILLGEEEELIRKIFNQKLRDLFLRLGKRNLHVETSKKCIAIHYDRLLKTDHIKRLMADTLMIYKALAEFEG